MTIFILYLRKLLVSCNMITILQIEVEYIILIDRDMNYFDIHSTKKSKPPPPLSIFAYISKSI